MDWKTFRALETFAIRYDIQIDEEQDNLGPCLVACAPKIDLWKLYRGYSGRREVRWPWEGTGYRLFPDTDGEFPNMCVELRRGAAADKDSLMSPRVWNSLPQSLPVASVDANANTCSQIECYWGRLLLIKHVRACLMRTLDTAADEAFTALGDLLIRTAPLLPHRLLEVPEVHSAEDMAVSDEDWQIFVLRVLYLNEASACHSDFQSLALADAALDTLTAVLGAYYRRVTGESTGPDTTEGRSPYELVALYNKAQGYLHVHEHSKAQREFRKIFEEWEWSYDCSDVPGPLRWHKECELLFRAYVFVPAALQSADTLTNLQRSSDSQRDLEEAKARRAGVPAMTSYQTARWEALHGRNLADLGQMKSRHRQGLEESLERFPSHQSPRLHLQLLSVLTQADCVDAKPPYASFTARLDDRIKIAYRHRSEFDQAVLSWAKGIETIADEINSADRSTALRDLLLWPLPTDAGLSWPQGFETYLNAALDLATDSRYREHKVEVRRTLVKLLELLVWDCSRARCEADSQLAQRLSETADTLWHWACPEPPQKRPELPEIAKHELRELSELWRKAAGPRTPCQNVLPVSGKTGEGATRDNCSRQLRHFLAECVVGCAERSVDACRSEFCCLQQDVTGDSGTHCADSVLRNSSEWREFAERQHSDQRHTRSWRHFWDFVMTRNRAAFQGRLSGSGFAKVRTPSGAGFLVLQRWNSFTPALQTSPGGGYFVFHDNDSASRSSSKCPKGCKQGCGLAIDPGYSFLRNFFSEGLAIKDLDAVVITHDHPDHMADFEAIKNLLAEIGKGRHSQERPEAKRITAFLSEGAFVHLAPSIESGRKVFADTRVLELRKKSEAEPIRVVEECSRLTLTPLVALHRDLSDAPGFDGYDSLGLRLELQGADDKSRCRVGITSDTRFRDCDAEKYSDCQVLVLHLGGLVPDRHDLVDYFLPDELDRIVHSKDHLYLPGVVWFLSQCHKAVGRRIEPSDSRLVILSEFGEEMRGGLRVDLAKRLQKYVDRNLDRAFVVVPGDVGLLVDPLDGSLRCSCCGQFFPWRSSPDGFEFEVFGDEEQIFYVCPACQACTSSHQRGVVYARRQQVLNDVPSI